MKSKAQILAEKIDKMFEERGLKVRLQEEKKDGYFVYIPAQKNASSTNNKLNKQERK